MPLAPHPRPNGTLCEAQRQGRFGRWSLPRPHWRRMRVAPPRERQAAHLRRFVVRHRWHKRAHGARGAAAAPRRHSPTSDRLTRSRSSHASQQRSHSIGKERGCAGHDGGAAAPPTSREAADAADGYGHGISPGPTPSLDASRTRSTWERPAHRAYVVAPSLERAVDELRSAAAAAVASAAAGRLDRPSSPPVLFIFPGQSQTPRMGEGLYRGDPFTVDTSTALRHDAAALGFDLRASFPPSAPTLMPHTCVASVPHRHTAGHLCDGAALD